MRLRRISHGYHERIPSQFPRPSLVGWYRILRAYHHWTVFEAVRFALWLWK